MHNFKPFQIVEYSCCCLSHTVWRSYTQESGEPVNLLEGLRVVE